MSYWAAHAHTGAPSRGHEGREVEWAAWNDADAAPKLLVLDTAADGGVRMSSERVTHASLKQAVLDERGFVTPGLHATLYRGLFSGSAFRDEEYQRLGGKAKESAR
jgi:hypothetical protein